MLLPQSSAFAALKNRLNSVSSIGFLHIAPRPYVHSSSNSHHATTTNPAGSAPHSRQGSVVEAIQSLQHEQQRQQQPSSMSSSSRTGVKFSENTHAPFPPSTASTPSGSNFGGPNRLKGREDGIIRWNELLEKFRSVQERARRAQRRGGDNDEPSSLGLSELRLSEDKSAKESKAGPPVPLKDPPAPAPAPAKRSGLGRQFGRLGGAVGRSKR